MYWLCGKGQAGVAREPDGVNINTRTDGGYAAMNKDSTWQPKLCVVMSVALLSVKSEHQIDEEEALHDHDM